MDSYYELKNQYKECIIFVKIGLFYNTYNYDALIIHHLTNYKLFNNNGLMCVSFTDKSLDLVLSRLRNMKCGYVVKNKIDIIRFLGYSYNELLYEVKKVNERELLLLNINENIDKLNTNNLKELLKYIEERV